MATNKEIKNRIQAIQVTKKITKAMQMVAASKLERVKKKATPIQYHLQQLTSIANHHLPPTTTTHPQKRELIIVSTSDKGLCGAFNNTILQRIQDLYKEKELQKVAIEFIPIGKKSLTYFINNQLPYIKNYATLHQKLTQNNVEALADTLIQYQELHPHTHITIAYQASPTPSKDSVVLQPLYPTPNNPTPTTSQEFIYETSAKALQPYLQRQILTFQLYHALITSQLVEHKTRMIVMHQATDNSEKMLKKLQLLSNSKRQALITQETTEIATAGIN